MNFLTVVLLPFSWLVFCSASLYNGCTDLPIEAFIEYYKLGEILTSNVRSISNCISPYKKSLNADEYRACISAIGLPDRIEKPLIAVTLINTIFYYEDVLRSICSEIRDEYSRSGEN